MAECLDCNAKFHLPGQSADSISAITCPECGSNNYRQQPNPLHSEMAMRNMPAPGEEDMGGNPLQEGILADGGWKDRQKRDESFASVKTAEDWNFMEEGDDPPQIESAFKFVIVDGQPYVEAEPTSHEIILMNNGFDTDQSYERAIAGLITNEGDLQIWQNPQHFPDESIGQILTDAGFPIRGITQSETKSLDQRNQELIDIGLGVRNPHGVPSVGPELRKLHQPHPRFGPDQQWAVRGGGTLDMEPYLPWDAPEEFEIKDVIVDPELEEDLEKESKTATNPLGDAANAVGDAAGAIGDIGTRGQSVGDAASWMWGAAKDAGTWAYHNPDVVAGAVAGGLLGSFTPAGPVGGAMIGADLGDTAGDQLGIGQGNQTDALLQKAPGPIGDFFKPQDAPAGAGAGAFRPLGKTAESLDTQDLSQLDPDGEAGELFADLFPLIVHYATTSDSGLEHPALQELDKKIQEELGHKASAGLGLIRSLIGKAIGRGGVGVGEQTALDTAGAGEQAANSGWLQRLQGGLNAGPGMPGYGQAGLEMGSSMLTGMPPDLGGMTSGLMAGAMAGKQYGKAGQYLGYMGGSSLHNMGQDPPAPPPGPVIPNRPPGTLGKRADYERPGAITERGTEGGPEEVDPHEVNVGDNDPIYDPGKGSLKSKNPYFQSDGSGAESLGALLPLVISYFTSDKSGEEHPFMRLLDSALNSESPGYRAHGDQYLGKRGQICENCGGTGAKQVGYKHYPCLACNANKVAGMLPTGVTPAGQPDMQPSMNPGHVPNPAQQAGAPGTQRQCPQCGANIPPDSATCPQCAANAAPPMPELYDPYIGAKTIAAAEPVPTADYSSPKCHNCGAILPPGGSMICPNCNQPSIQMGVPQPQPRQAHQGPHNHEQFAAVADLLTDQGREDEIPAMLAQPELYSEEMAQVQKKTFQPIDEEQGLPEPAQEEAPPEETMPVPPMQAPEQQMMAAVERNAAADSYAPRCPKCNSGSTGFDSEDGDISCHACGHQWKKEIIHDSLKTGEHHDHAELHEDPNVQGIPAADRERPRDVEREQDTSLRWADENGEPLHVGREYEMHSENYDIPDIVRIDSVKPDAITYTLTGEYGLEHRTEVSHDEADIERLTFVPTDAVDPASATDMEPSTDDDYERTSPGEDSDLSIPSIKKTRVGADYINMEPNWEGMRAWLKNMAKTDLPNAIRVNLEMGNEAIPLDELAQIAGVSEKEIHNLAGNMGDIGNLPETEHPLGPQTGRVSYPEPPPDQFGSPQDFRDVWDEEPPGLMEETRGDLDEDERRCYACKGTGKDENGITDCRKCFGEGTLRQGFESSFSRKAPNTIPVEWKTAGAKFTPMEQREFIDEPGEARNRNKLNLKGTHYDEENFGDDDILFL